jgi:hypothetical protein
MKSAQRIKQIEAGQRNLSAHIVEAVFYLEDVRDRLIAELTDNCDGVVATFDNNPDFWKAYPGLFGVPHQVHRIAAALAVADIAADTGVRPDIRIQSTRAATGSRSRSNSLPLNSAR